MAMRVAPSSLAPQRETLTRANRAHTRAVTSDLHRREIMLTFSEIRSLAQTSRELPPRELPLPNIERSFTSEQTCALGYFHSPIS